MGTKISEGVKYFNTHENENYNPLIVKLLESYVHSSHGRYDNKYFTSEQPSYPDKTVCSFSKYGEHHEALLVNFTDGTYATVGLKKFKRHIRRMYKYFTKEEKEVNMNNVIENNEGEIKLNIPEGYEINKTKSNLEKGIIILRKAKIKKWEELQAKRTEKYKTSESAIRITQIRNRKDQTMPEVTYFSTCEEASAFMSFIKLVQLHKEWCGDNIYEYCITSNNDGAIVYRNHPDTHHILNFKNEEERDDFYNAFTDLIQEAKMFI